MSRTPITFVQPGSDPAGVETVALDDDPQLPSSSDSASSRTSYGFSSTAMRASIPSISTTWR